MKFLNFNKVLCLGAHPDDVEYGMLGSMCKFTDKEFDFLTAWDVLEHLLPDQIDSALLEMQRVSNRFAFTIAYDYASTPPPKKFSGHNLHQTVKEPEWWKEKIEKYAEVTQQNDLWLGKWK